MKIGKNLNQFSFDELINIIEGYDKYTDFNVLGLYRSIYESKKMSLYEKIIVRDTANKFFGKTFEFLQIKDPFTYFKISTLGMELTKADEYQIWHEIRTNQERILKDKNINHRNFGVYSKHDCGYDFCPLNGLMIKKGSPLEVGTMHFESDRNKNEKKLKSQKIKKLRKDKSSYYNGLNEE